MAYYLPMYSLYCGLNLPHGKKTKQEGAQATAAALVEVVVAAAEVRNQLESSREGNLSE